MTERRVRADGDGDAIEAPIDLVEWDGEYVVQIDLPGFTADSIDLTVSGTTLHVEADSRESIHVPVEAFHRRERDVRPVHQSIELPTVVDEDGVVTDHTDGVLTVRLPKEYDRVGE